MMKKPNIKDWDYRLLHDVRNGKYCIAEVYYNDKNKPAAWCEADMVNYDTPQELYKEIQHMKKAFDGTMIIYENEKFKEKKI